MLPYLAGFAILLTALSLHRFGLVEYFNRMTYDLLLWKRGQRTVPPEIVIVDIDEKSLRALGRWPWSREVLANLVSSLSEYQVNTVAFDAIFSEHADEQGDNLLAKAISESNTKVVLGYFMHMPGAGVGRMQSRGYKPDGYDERLQTLFPSALSKPFNMGNHPTNTCSFEYLKPSDLVTPIGPFSAAADAFGFFNNWPDPDNTSRSMIAVQPIDKYYFPSLAMQAVATYLAGDIQLYCDTELNELKFEITNAAGESQLSGNFVASSQLLLNYYGTLGTFPYISIIDILEKEVDPSVLKDKLVFVGASVPGLYDLVEIPLEIFRGLLAPGVELHATQAANLLKEDFLHYDEVIYFIAFLLFFPITLVILLPKTSAFFGLLATLVFAGCELGISQLMLNNGAIVAFGVPWMTLLFVYTGVTFVKYSAEEAQKRFIKRAFSHYLAPTVVEQIAKDPDQLRLQGERRVLTILFSDIRGFTTISETLTPTALRDLLTSYLSPMTEIILNQQGTLDKYIGDAIMAFYGAPLDVPKHRSHACQSAIDMIKRLEELNQKPGRPRLEIGIGINSGVVSVGNMGSETLFDYTALGDAVNLASRLEGITKQYGVSTVVSESTQKDCTDNFLFRELDHIRVKGKNQAITIYELQSTVEEASDDQKDLIKKFHYGLNIYRQKKWPEAIRCFEDIMRFYPLDKPAQIFLKRCQQFLEHMPDEVAAENWDGVYQFTTK